VSLLLSYILWALFFVSHGPDKILFVAIPTYLGLWVLTVGVIIWIVYINKLPTKRDSELWSFLESQQCGGPMQEYSWEYVTSVAAVKCIDKDHFLFSQSKA